MLEDKPKVFTDAVQYMQQYKAQYSLEELKKKLHSSGYPGDVILEAEKHVFSVADKNNTEVGHTASTVDIEEVSTGKRLGQFIIGFIGYFILTIAGLGIIGFGVAVFLYFYLKKKYPNIARGLRSAFIVSLLLIAVGVFFIIAAFDGLF